MKVLEELPRGWRYERARPTEPVPVPGVRIRDHRDRDQSEALPSVTRPVNPTFSGRADELYWTPSFLEELNARMTNGGLFLVPEHPPHSSAVLCAGIWGVPVPFLRIYCDGRVQFLSVFSP